MKFIESQDNRKQEKQDRTSVKAELRDKVKKELDDLKKKKKKKSVGKCREGSVIANLKFLFEIE